MISKKTFDDLQIALRAVGKPRKRQNEKVFEFLNFATCGSCGFSITGERHVKKNGSRYHYYRCTHKSKKVRCNDRSFIREEQFAGEVKRNVELLFIPDDWKEKFLAKIETWEAEGFREKQAHTDRLNVELAAVKGKIGRINAGFTDGSLDIVEFKELKNPLVSIKTDLEQKIINLERNKGNRLEPLKNLIFEANQAQKWVSETNWLEMKSFLKRSGSNRFLRAQTLTVAFKIPLNSLAETTVAVRSTSDISEQSSLWWSLADLNRFDPSTYPSTLLEGC
jgi:hypothetical protein